MTRIIFHIDVNSAYLSWTAVEQLKNGSKVDLREIPAITAVQNRMVLSISSSLQRNSRLRLRLTSFWSTRRFTRTDSTAP